MGNTIEALKIKYAATSVISFATSYERKKNMKQNKEKKQKQSKSSSSPSFISQSLDFLQNQNYSDDNNKYKQIFQIPKLLHSLYLLTNYKPNIHINIEQDQQSYWIRFKSRKFLGSIQYKGDEQVQVQLINVGYGRVLIIPISTAGGAGKQKDDEIYWGLNDIYNLLSEFRYGRNFPFTSFQPLPALAKPCIEQIEEEGGNEEVESLLINNANEWNINNQAKCAIRDIFNYFIHSSNPRPFWYR